jgi:hypothetical protein
MRVPQSLQNAHVFMRPLSHTTVKNFRSPESNRTLPLGTISDIPKALPDWR